MLITTDIGNGSQGQVLGSDGIATLWFQPVGTGFSSLTASSTGFTETPNPAFSNLTLLADPAGPAVTGSIVLPSMLNVWQQEYIFRIFSAATVTAFSLQLPSDGSGITFAPSATLPTSLAPGDIYSYYYNTFTNSWWSII